MNGVLVVRNLGLSIIQKSSHALVDHACIVNQSLITNKHGDDAIGLLSLTKASIKYTLLMLDQIIQKSDSCVQNCVDQALRKMKDQSLSERIDQLDIESIKIQLQNLAEDLLRFLNLHSEL